MISNGLSRGAPDPDAPGSERNFFLEGVTACTTCSRLGAATSGAIAAP